MMGFRLMFVLSLFFYGVVFQPDWARADDAAVKVDKGDIVWTQTDGSRNQIYFTTFSSEKDAWSAPVKVTDDEYRNGNPTVDSGPDGKKVLAWVAGSGSDYMIHYSVGTEGAWSKSAAIPSTLKVNLAPSVMIDGSGQRWVAWSGNDGDQDEIYYSRYVGNNWTAPVRVNSGNEVPDILPEISLNEKGVPQVTWTGYRNGTYIKLKSTFEGDNWTSEMEVEASSEDEETQRTASIENMPSFIEQPDKAFVRIYKFSSVK
jgi:hypothetical protein